MSAAPPEFQRKKSPSRKASVSPSSPGSVDAWLDMLVSMLALPKPERQRVRDELEDHLRSRIDDLLITGLTEPEALKQAASELGETADLARQLTHAHAPPRKRTYAMHAALFALAGSIVAIGIATMGPGQNRSSNMISSGVAGVVPIEEARGVLPEEAVASIAFEDLDFPAAFRAVAESFNLTPGLSATMLNRYEKHGTRASMSGEFTLSQAMSRLLSFDPYGTESNAYYIEDGRIVITDPMVVIRRSVKTRTYALDWLDANEHRSVMSAVSFAIEGGPYPQFVQVDHAVGSLVVTARSEALDDVERILAELRANFEQRMMQSIQATDERSAQLRALYETLFEKWTGLMHSQKMGEKRLAIFQPEPGLDETTVFSAYTAMEVDLERLDLEINEVESRLRYIRSQMIATEYDTILDGLPARGAKPLEVFTESVRIEGDVQRPGEFELPIDGISLKRLLAATGNMSAEPGRVHVLRDGEHFITVNIQDLQGEGGDIELKIGDRVQVVINGRN